MSMYGKRMAALMGTVLFVGALTACNSDSPGGSSAAVTPPAPTPVAGAKCDAKYGNPPRPLTTSFGGLLSLASLCTSLRGESLSWQDADGTARMACLVSPPGTTTASPRPLLVWLHPSLYAMESIYVTDLPTRMATADLNGDPTRPGYSLLLVGGRDTAHFYPAPNDAGLGWDNWYRNLDRSSPALNVDVATLDHFIGTVKDRGIVDPKRVYLSGWSNGSAMAQMYALNTPGIAAAAVYSSPNPFGDSTDPCPQAAFGNNKVALLHVGNQCDIIGICDSSAALLGDLDQRGLAAPVVSIRVNELLQEVQGCSTSTQCTAPVPINSQTAYLTQGANNHARWPISYTQRMLNFLRDHPLP